MPVVCLYVWCRMYVYVVFCVCACGMHVCVVCVCVLGTPWTFPVRKIMSFSSKKTASIDS